MSELMTTTYSMWRLFRNCRKACEYRYLRDLVPLERDHNLAFGSVIHDCLEIWHGQRDLEKVLEHIDQVYANRAQDDHQLADWHLATAMMSSYTEQYPVEDFNVVALEKTFEAPSSIRIPTPHRGVSCWLARWTVWSSRMANTSCWSTRPPHK